VKLACISIPKWSDFSDAIDSPTGEFKSISIPKWSDFSTAPSRGTVTVKLISIPKWSDFSPIQIVLRISWMVYFNPKMV